ncbi:MAG: phosphatase PAP2 family protein [Caulobacter sp.]|nr:phosphatase PAP2 family protein [Caulobacter sp.]
MAVGRRNFLRSVAISALWVGFGKATQAQAADQESTDKFRRIFGAPNFRSPDETLKFLKAAQDKRVVAPRDAKAFAVYLKSTPLGRAINDPAAPEIVHLAQWNAFALDLTAQDHTTIKPLKPDPAKADDSDPSYAEQLGPHRSSRALAIMHLAMFEAVNTIYRRYKSYRDVQAKIFGAIQAEPAKVTPLTASVRRAIAVSAYDTLIVLYPNKRVLTEAMFRLTTLPIGDSEPMQVLGSAIGEAAARFVLEERKYDPQTKQFGDGSEYMRPPVVRNSLDLEPTYAQIFSSPTPEDWRIDPITGLPKAIGGYWGHVEPFALDPANLHLPPGPPAATSARFKKDYDDVRSVGGDPNPAPLGARRRTPTKRTGTQPNDALDSTNETFKANFWAYDGTALLCAPPRLYNMVATSVATKEYKILEAPDMARYLALINICLADAGIAAWTAKYKYHLARPITWIRGHQPADVINGVANGDWTPLGAPVSNGSPEGANLTPPFPSYPSGHATFGGALFEAMTQLLPLPPSGETRFKFVSDEYNGLNRGPLGEARPYVEREFASFEAAAAENARSRIWLGIHWQFDGDDGIDQGREIAKDVIGTTLLKI